MANPASELAAILEGWVVAEKQTIYKARGSRSSSLQLWDEVVKAVHCLAGIDRILSAMAARGEDVSDFRVSLPAWFGAVFEPDVAWNQVQSHARRGIAAVDLANLKMFARLIDAQGLTDSISPETLAEIVESLGEMEDVVSEVDLGEPAKHRILWHIQQARMFANDIERFGEAVVIQTAVAVANESIRFVNDSDLGPEPAGRLRRAAAGIFVNAAGSTVAGGLVAIAPQVINAIAQAT